MTNVLAKKAWPPYVVGALIGVLSWFAFATADAPLGITTAFEHTAALAEKAIVPEVEQTNSYFSEKKAQGKPPKIDWQWMLVIGVYIGAFVSSRISGDRTSATVPPLWRWRFGSSAAKRLVIAFLSGGLMMFGARLAQGCTSGHGISGAMQFAVSSWIFIVEAFGMATVMTFAMYGREGAKHV